MIHNPKTDSKSEFGGLDKAEEREWIARGARLAISQPLCAMCGPRVAQGQSNSLPTCATRVPHVEVT